MSSAAGALRALRSTVTLRWRLGSSCCWPPSVLTCRGACVCVRVRVCVLRSKQYDNIVYMPCVKENGFFPDLAPAKDASESRSAQHASSPPHPRCSPLVLLCSAAL